jgi:hypothetical protein
MRKLLIATAAILMGSTMAATAKVDRKCMREYRDWLGFGPGELKRHCTPENFVTNPKEYGWYRDPTVEGCSRDGVDHQ